MAKFKTPPMHLAKFKTSPIRVCVRTPFDKASVQDNALQCYKLHPKIEEQSPRGERPKIAICERQSWCLDKPVYCTTLVEIGSRKGPDNVNIKFLVLINMTSFLSDARITLKIHGASLVQETYTCEQ
ncbi:hypothetical protein C5167_033065, partial [Papaver somniferum]